MNTLVFPILLLLLTTLCLWIVIGSKGSWSLKFWLINVCGLFFFFFWISVNSFLGWPTDRVLPDKFRLASFVANEPVCIYVVAFEPDEKKWQLRKIFEYKPEDSIRMYKFPYSKKFHENLEKAMERVQKGNYVVMSKEKILEAEELREFNSMQKLLDSTLQSETPSPNDAYKFYVMPPAKIIKKPEP